MAGELVLPGGQPVLVDTDVVSYALRGDSRSELYRPYLQGRDLLVSFITVAELHRGALVRAWGPDRRRRLEHYLTRFGLVGFDRTLCLVWATMMAAAERRGRVLAANDSWIAATALYAGIPLVTNNQRHFAGIDGLQVISEAPTSR
ncbi:MAG TPA: type II toxin-antitoxin system VapC family toxin [Chloroflexota bacterium]